MDAKPECRYFGLCGGCSFQDIPYQEQLSKKEESLQQTLDMKIEVTPAPKPYRYRNRMDFVFSFGKAGLRKKGTFREVIELEECHLLSEKAEKAFLRARKLVLENQIPDFNYLSKRGYLRYIVVREAQSTGQIMLILVTSTRDPIIEKTAETLAKDKDIHSVVWSINDTLSDTSYGVIEKTWKNPTMTEKLGNISLEIGPNSFSQNNTEVSQMVYTELKGFVKGRTLDLYCGVGSIALFVADKASSITGVDSVEESVQLAKSNAEKNKIKASFHHEQARKFLRETSERFDTIICDPPREGVGPNTIKHIIRLLPDRLIMVSCKPKTLAADLELLSKTYKITHVKGFDMFPQTPHVEVLIVLEREGCRLFPSPEGEARIRPISSS